MVPSMHEPMFHHPAVRENLDRLRGWGVSVLAPRMEEGKAKIPDEETILKEVKTRLLSPRGDRFLEGERILVTTGRTVEYLDSVRVISNNSSGKMGAAVAEAAQKAGAEVTLIAGKTACRLPDNVRIIKAETADQMAAAVETELKENKYDRIIAAAAVGDWKPEVSVQGKIPTHGTGSLTVTLVPTVKILDRMREQSPESQITAFRALPQADEALLRKDAVKRMEKARADFIAVNDVSAPGCGFETDTNRLLIISADATVSDTGFVSKTEAAVFLLKRLADQ